MGPASVRGERKNALAREEIQALLGHVRSLVAGAVEQMYAGDLSINPVRKKGMDACAYCEYGGVCRFDESAGDRPRYLPPLAQAELLGRIAKEDAHGMD